MREIRSPFDGFRSPFGARGGFNPLALFAAAEPGIWLDPSDIATLFQDAAGTTPVTAAGQPVGLVLDKSGRGNHATQATSSKRPTYQTDGTMHWLAFDGVDDAMATGTITPGVDKVQVFAGVRKLSDAAVGVFLETSVASGSNNGAFALFAPGSVGPTYLFSTRGTSSSGSAVGTFSAPITNVVTGLGDISADTAIIRVNGAQVLSSPSDQGTGNYLAYPVYIGARAGTSLYFNGNLYGLTVRFGPNLTAAQIAQAEAYTAGKTGVTL